ncbi:hydroxyethylthiazole kinase [Chitinasiproducens palmae]|uniref:Hydroxyethylthiazole kinase n=1 Tax=Chitinasiproducens palmae TaxID=1770053 RepID=A0A1H2PMY4_9BURK|nr:hydroxyethylthiazole kinase [Chitinasiproducens palmae]SDV47508.1 hydroxyethylthiazole kinase [Chitinasiproducens palmae]
MPLTSDPHRPTAPAQPDAGRLYSLVETLRQRAPLIHCLSNTVVENFVANVLLALGAAPAMVVDAGEAAEFAPVADALSINLGTLTEPQAVAMRAAVQAANAAGRPWVLDPVAVGHLSLRTRFAHELLAVAPAIIRGNASEIIALAGAAGGGRCVESTARSEAALPAAIALARARGAVVALTGETDYVTDGERVAGFANGDPVMQRVTGVGCALSATCAAFVGICSDRWLAACAAVAYTGVCGQLAARAHDVTPSAQAGPDAVSRPARPGSFMPSYLDWLAGLGQDDFLRLLRPADA